MKTILKFSLLAATVLTPTTALAQSEDATLENPQARVAEIVVTARKTDESINSAPIAITAFTGETLNN